MSKIVLKAGKERSLYRLHPWVFSGAIAKIKGDVQEGDVVQVYNSDDEYLATGHYQIGSIAVRVLTFKEEEIDYNFWVERIRQAYTATGSRAFDKGEQQRLPTRSWGR